MPADFGEDEFVDTPDGLQLTAFDDDFHRDPYAVYARLRTADPVHRDQVSFYPKSWTVSDHATVQALLSDKRLSVDPRSIGLRRDPRADNPVTLRAPDMMSLDDPDHARLRGLVQKAFTPSSVAAFTPTVERIVQNCLDALDESPVEIMTSYAKPIPTIAIAEFIGVDSADHEQFKRWTDSLGLQGYPQPTEAQWEEVVAADAALRAYVGQVIEHRRRQPADDLVTRLIDAHESEHRLTDAEVVDMCYLLIGAGNFTTTDLIGNALYMCLQNGLRHEDMEAVVEECLRFDSPVLGVRRYATEDIAVGGQTISQGSVVNLLLGAANHDPQVFDQPELSLVGRDNQRHLAFGRGIHHCLGAALARLEARIAVAAFTQRFPSARIVEAQRARRMDFRGFKTLLVHLEG